MVTYKLNRKKISIEEFENVDVFGITAIKNGKVVLNVEDISANELFVLEIMRKLAEYEVSLYHVMDVIEDEMYAYAFI